MTIVAIFILISGMLLVAAVLSRLITGHIDGTIGLRPGVVVLFMSYAIVHLLISTVLLARILP